MSSRPNFLVFITDQQRADHLSCMGNRVLRTPNIDRLANEGCAFDNHYVNNPVCMPSRATLFTGRTPRGHHVRGNGIGLDPRIPTFTGALAQAGYRTHNVGKIHLTPYGLPRGADLKNLKPVDFPEAHAMWNNGLLTQLPPNYYGLQTAEVTLGHGSYVAGNYRQWVQEKDPAALKYFDKAHMFLRELTGADQSAPWAMPPELHHSTYVADRTIAFLEDQAKAQAAAGDQSQPFFTFASFPDPHHPYTPVGKYADLYKPADVELPRARRENEFLDMPPHYKITYEKGMLVGGRMRATKMPDNDLREIIALTYGMIGLIDDSVGRVLGALDRLKLSDNTVVIFMSDHADLMGDHYMHNKGPFLYRGLTRVPFLVRTPAMVCGQTPAGRRIGAHTSHLDFAPTILNLAGVPIPEGYTPPECESPLNAPAWPGYALTPMLDNKQANVRTRDRVLIEYDEDYLGDRLRGVVTPDFRVTMYPGRPHGELFDLKKDPDELRNLWNDPGAKSLKQEALAQLAEELALTDLALPRRFCHA